jgi:hypothetical protein
MVQAAIWIVAAFICLAGFMFVLSILRVACLLFFAFCKESVVVFKNALKKLVRSLKNVSVPAPPISDAHTTQSLHPERSVELKSDSRPEKRPIVFPNCPSPSSTVH